jgi:hypothetical protein
MTSKTTVRTKNRSKAAVKTPAPTAPVVSNSGEALAKEALATGERACPTRLDGASPLFQHRLTVNQCQSKQRGMYHKCFSCAHSNARR